ncbi:MAG: oxidoreductase [Clostridiales bacterium GWB2_37_7]|nr:MAG: oxidoreductase [Clostridiales bacterium GWB2_37_7]
MKKKINTAIIGYGMAGSVFHCPIISSLDGFEIAKIYTNNPQSINAIHRLYPNTKPVSDVNEILSDVTIELVVIASPNTFHYSLAKEALLAGKNIVIDKPFTVHSEEAEELIHLAQKQNRVMSIFQNRRWDSDFKTVKKVIDSGMLGHLVECEIHMDRYRNYIKDRAWREDDIPGSGVLFDLGSHLIDQSLNLFGVPKAITADLRMQRQVAKTTDHFEMILHYDKLKVSLKSGMLVRAELPHFILLGENGSFVKYGVDVQEEDLKSGLTPLTKHNWGQEPESLYGTINTTINGLDIKGMVKSENGDYRGYYTNIYHSILHHEALIVTPQQAKNTIRLIEYAMESNEKKCTLKVTL